MTLDPDICWAAVVAVPVVSTLTFLLGMERGEARTKRRAVRTILWAGLTSARDRLFTSDAILAKGYNEHEYNAYLRGFCEAAGVVKRMDEGER